MEGCARGASDQVSVFVGDVRDDTAHGAESSEVANQCASIQPLYPRDIVSRQMVLECLDRPPVAGDAAQFFDDQGGEEKRRDSASS